MNRRSAWALAGVAFLVAAGLLIAVSGAFVPLLGEGYDPGGEGDYEHASVAVIDSETGTELGSVTAAIADTSSKRILGLSDTDELPEDRGMLFVHHESAEYTYVMRKMSFGIDIVFIAPDGTITTIHEAPKPGPNEDGNAQEYPGEGKYVLEVNQGWTAERGIEPGDRVEFDL
jgi:uncharacterized membrane protein (UPF0127 family)